MTPSIYDMKENEIELAERLRRERVKAIVGVFLGAPVSVALLAAWVVFCALL